MGIFFKHSSIHHYVRYEAFSNIVEWTRQGSLWCVQCSRHEGFRTIPWGLLGGGLRQCTVPNPLPRHGCRRRRRHFPARHRHTPRLHFEIWTAYSVLSSCCFPKRDNLAIQSIIHEERVDLHIHESTVAFPFDRDESLWNWRRVCKCLKHFVVMR